MEVQCKTFPLSADAVPTVDMMQRAGDPTSRAELLRAAGFELLARNAPQLQKADVAARSYVELPKADYDLYTSFLINSTTPERATVAPPDDALTMLVAARQANLFDRVIVLAHPTSQESLMLGVVSVGEGVRYFKLAQWGEHLTTIEELRRQQRFSRALVKFLVRVLSWRPNIQFDWPQHSRTSNGYRKPSMTRSAFFYGGITMGAAGLCWAVFLATGHWWLFAPLLIVAMILVGIFFYNNGTWDWDHGPGYTVGWLIALNLIGGIPGLGITHLVQYENADRTAEVLVCDSVQREYDDSKYVEISTNEGKLTLDPGFYNGTYYPHGTTELGDSLVGNWVRVTEHGHMGGRYVTEAKTVRAGSCAE